MIKFMYGFLWGIVATIMVFLAIDKALQEKQGASLPPFPYVKEKR